MAAPYLRAQVLRLPRHVEGHLPAARGQVEDGGGGHVGGLHVVAVVEAALAAGAAGAAAPAAASRAPSASAAATAQAAATAAGGVGAGGAAGRAGVLAVTFGCGCIREIQHEKKKQKFLQKYEQKCCRCHKLTGFTVSYSFFLSRAKKLLRSLCRVSRSEAFSSVHISETLKNIK